MHCLGAAGRRRARLYPALAEAGIKSDWLAGNSIGALIATGELDAVIFFADPAAPYGSDVDLQALTRLAIVHDTPIALSVSAADMVVDALLTTSEET